MDTSFIKPTKNFQEAPEQPASPLALTAAYENVCGICFTEIHRVDNPRGRLNSCNHLFCSHCIKEWAKNTNVCPTCKARFTRIYTFKAATQEEEETKVRKRNYKAWELAYYDDEEEEEWEGSSNRASPEQERVVCDICQLSSNAVRMIFCDRRECPYAAHLDCLGLPERPLTFLCPRCRPLREEENKTDTADMFVSPPTAHSPVAPAETLVASTKGEVAPSRTECLTVAAFRHTRGRHVPASFPNPSPPSHSAASQMDATQSNSRALFGGSCGNSSASSPRQLSSPKPSEPVAVPRTRIDLSKPYIPPLPPSTTTSQRSRPHRRGDGTANADDVYDEYYFLAPTSHAVSSTIELERSKANRAACAQIRRQRERTKAERLETAYDMQRPNINFSVGRKRHNRTPAEEFSEELVSGEKELTDPQLRRAMEERMVRQWAASILPVMRRRRYIEGDTVTTEADMWNLATAQARKMVREKLDAKGAALRRRREQLVRAQAVREAAALAKLARIIAQHREQEQQSLPHP